MVKCNCNNLNDLKKYTYFYNYARTADDSSGVTLFVDFAKARPLTEFFVVINLKTWPNS